MRLCPLAAAAVLLAPAVPAQFGAEWIRFERDDAMLSATQPVSDADHETDLAWDDLDQDGDVDLVVVRAVPYIFPGKRSNVLLVNEAGVLVERTATLAASSDVPGDHGFLTPTQDRDVVLVDVDGDGWPDVVTAADLWQPGDSKAVTHPRVYRNLGSGVGAWPGLTHEDFRVPQLLVGGLAGHPRFMSVAAADIDADGDVDLYFGDQDFLAQGVDEPAAEDMGDRLLVNDGNGVFSDGTGASFSPAQVDSTFHNAVVFDDFNLDGYADLLQEDGYFDPTAIIYNRPALPGVFGANEPIYFGSGYFADSGDLNADGRPDIAISDNGADKFVINTGNDATGQAVWGPISTYEYLTGGDPGIAANNLIADLDGDGWSEVLIADVDPEIPGYERRLQIFHNRGGTVGGTDVVLREERQSASDDDWIGVVGMDAEDLAATHDVAVFDVDGDGLSDLIVSQLAGTFVWRQVSAWNDLGSGLAGAAGIPGLVGQGALAAGNRVSLSVSGAAPLAPTTFVIGLSALNAAFKGGTLVPAPDVLLDGVATDGSGTLALAGPWPPGVPAGLTVHAQAWIVDAGGPLGLAASNAVSAATP